MNANTYYDLIDKQKNLTEPPILKHITNKKLQTFICPRGENQVYFQRLLCHPQAVEKTVKTVTEASGTLCTNKAREGFFESKIELR